ncbi:MAG TPA: nucleotidyltransferase family protein [Candidatus Thermoplasmatota archaeon]|nr:nucleotidyltransferase family protein [Candidatus Thermoplasmatota archaeon]
MPVTLDPSTRPGRLLSQRREEVLALARAHGATDVRVFGSVARGDAGPESDVDLLVTFSPRASVFARLDLEEALQQLLGIRVEVVTPEALHRLIRDEVLREAVDV